MSALGTLFKHFKFGNYFLKKSNSLIFNALNTHVFIKSYSYLRPLTNVSGHSLTFSKLK